MANNQNKVKIKVSSPILKITVLVVKKITVSSTFLERPGSASTMAISTVKSVPKYYLFQNMNKKMLCNKVMREWSCVSIVNCFLTKVINRLLKSFHIILAKTMQFKRQGTAPASLARRHHPILMEIIMAL